MKRTKNIYIRDNQFGFSIYNNGGVVAYAGDTATAENIALKIAKRENKKSVVFDTFYDTHKINL